MAAGQVDDSRKCEENSASDGKPDPSLDRLIKLAADIFNTPIAVLYLTVDNQLQSSHGLDDSKHVEIKALCTRTIDRNAPLAQSKSEPSGGLDFYTAVPLVTTTDQPIGALCIADHTSRAALSNPETARLQALAGLAADLVQHRKVEQSVEANSALFAAISHDIRTPMNGILGMAELLLTSDELDQRHRRRIEIIKRSGTTLLSMINFLVDLAGSHAKKPRSDISPVNLKELVHAAISQWNEKNASNTGRIALVDHLEGHHYVLGNVPQIQKLLSRFLESVIKVSPNGAIRLIASAKPTAPASVRMQLRAEMIQTEADMFGNLLAISGKNTLPKSGNINEVSLGLILCKKLAITMDGDIGVDQRIDDGTALWLEISLATDPKQCPRNEALEHHSNPASTTERSTKSKMIWNVLVAEDNPDMALLIEELVEEAGYHATVARDGTSALRLLDEKHFDVVLMDGHMPDMSGFEATARIRQLPDQRADLPIIALTGEALAGDRERYLSAGMDDYISKPVDYETLVETIDRCCSQRQHRTLSAVGTKPNL